MNKPSEHMECCPQFDPMPWDGKIFTWSNKKFIRDRVFTLFYIPLNFGRIIRKLHAKLQAANAKAPEWLCLSDHTSKWNMDIYLAVDQEIPNANNVIFNGKFFSKVYEGPYKNIKMWYQDFDKYTKDLGLCTQKLYMWYTTCPKCVKKYGKNYVVIIAALK